MREILSWWIEVLTYGTFSLLKTGADIVIPPYLGDRANLTPQEEAQTRTIAKLRIHVERVIERMKKFKILKKNCPIKHSDNILTNSIYSS